MTGSVDYGFEKEQKTRIEKPTTENKNKMGENNKRRNENAPVQSGEDNKIESKNLKVLRQVQNSRRTSLVDKKLVSNYTVPGRGSTTPKN